MALTTPKATLLHVALASISPEVATVDEIILTPACLPIELLITIREHLHTAITSQLYLNSTRALAKYETDLLSQFCTDCISYNHDVYGPDIWEWQQFANSCKCGWVAPNDAPKSPACFQQFANPFDWLENHLSLQAVHLSSTSPTPRTAIWDVVTDVLSRYHCESLQEESSGPITIQRGDVLRHGTNSVNSRKVTSFRQPPQSVPAVRIRPLPSALRAYETKGIGEVGDAGDAFRAEVILRRGAQELGLAIELKDVFSLPRKHSLLLKRHEVPDLCWLDSADFAPLHASSTLQGMITTCSLVSAVLGAFASLPLAFTILTITAICSRPIPLRVAS